MASLSTVYIIGILLVSIGGFGSAFLGNAISPIKGGFGDFRFDESNKQQIKEWLKPLFEIDSQDSKEEEEEVDTRSEEEKKVDENAEEFKKQREEQLQNRPQGGGGESKSTLINDATNFLTVPLDQWTKIGDNIGVIYTKFNAIRTLCHKQTNPEQKVALIKLCNLMALKYDYIIQEIERKFSLNEKLIKYEQIFMDAYNILEALHVKPTPNPKSKESEAPLFTGRSDTTISTDQPVPDAAQETEESDTPTSTDEALPDATQEDEEQPNGGKKRYRNSRS